MVLIPYQKLIITTDLPKEEVMDRLKGRVGPKKRKKFVRVDKNIFSGRLGNDKFNLILNTDYRNSWTPEVDGVIAERDNRTELIITLKSNSFVIAFTTLFVIIGLTMFIYELVGFKDAQEFDWLALVLVIFPYGLMWFGFNLDADKSIDGLVKISKGRLRGARPHDD